MNDLTAVLTVDSLIKLLIFPLNPCHMHIKWIRLSSAWCKRTEKYFSVQMIYGTHRLVYYCHHNVLDHIIIMIINQYEMHEPNLLWSIIKQDRINCMMVILPLYRLWSSTYLLMTWSYVVNPQRNFINMCQWPCNSVSSEPHKCTISTFTKPNSFTLYKHQIRIPIPLQSKWYFRKAEG